MVNLDSILLGRLRIVNFLENGLRKLELCVAVPVDLHLGGGGSLHLARLPTDKVAVAMPMRSPTGEQPAPGSSPGNLDIPVNKTSSVTIVSPWFARIRASGSCVWLTVSG